MTRLSPIDSISPAFSRTHALLFKPFKLGRSWKLAATSYLAFGGSFFFPFTLIYPAAFTLIPGFPHNAISFLWLGASIATILYAAFYYCCVRLQLVNFEMVVTLNRIIAPMWRRYPAKVWPWIAAKIVVGIVSLLIMVPILIGSVKGFAGVVADISKAGANPDPALISQMVSAMLGFYFLILVLFMIPKTLATLLDDFVLPFFLLEDLPLLIAVRRGFATFAADPVNCVLYLLLKLVVAVVGYFAQTLAIQVCMIPFVLVAGLIVFVGSLLFRHAGSAGVVIGVAGAVVLGVAFFVIVSYVSIFGFGYLLILLDSYAIHFLAGRYPLLGNLVEPGPGGPFTPPPVFPSPEEQDDADDGGPPMPLNPAVA